MSFPNPDWMTPYDPQWRPVTNKPGLYVHDDAPCCEVEIVLQTCKDHPDDQVLTMHRVRCKAKTKGHEPATDKARKEHATHACGKKMTVIPRPEAQWPTATAKPTAPSRKASKTVH
jgi:hypothetical protein